MVFFLLRLPICSPRLTADALIEPLQRYKQLLFFATKLEPLPGEDHTVENKVKGCVSQVWVCPRLADDGKIYWRADSDSQLTKGLAALLVQGLSGCTPEEIVRIQPEFIAMLGLQQSLTPSRNNGFLNMFKLMQAKALELYMQQQTKPSNGASADGSGSATSDNSDIASNRATTGDGLDNGPSTASQDRESPSPVQDSIRRKLESALEPVRLDVRDDSHKHAGHAAYKGKAGYSGETHFSVEVVSARFEGLSSIKRHRLVYQILDEEMKESVHALALVTKTPTEAGLE